MVQEETKSNIKLRKVYDSDEDENENNDSDDSLVEECRKFSNCPNAPHTVTCPLHYSRSRNDRIKFLVDKQDCQIM